MTYEQEAASALDFNCEMRVYPSDFPSCVQERMAQIKENDPNTDETAAMRIAVSELAAALAAKEQQPPQLVA